MKGRGEGENPIGVHFTRKEDRSMSGKKRERGGLVIAGRRAQLTAVTTRLHGENR